MKFRLNRFLNLCVIASLIFVSFLGGSKAEAAQGVHEPATIHLRAGEFRPAAGELPAIPADLTITGYAHGQPGTYLVQLAGPVLEEWKQGLAALGAEVLEYIPDFTFKVRMTPAIARLVEAESYVAWVGINQPGYKVDPALDLTVERLYRVRNEKGAQHAQVINEMTQVGANVSSAEGGVNLVQANSGQIKAILHNPNVAWVEAFTVNEFHNEFGGGQIMGSAIANANGYDGSGQVVAIADTGINTGDANSVPGIPPERITAIYNWPGVPNSCFSNIQDDGPQDINGHGTHTSGSILSAGIDGKGRGTAPGASLIFQAMENWAYGTFSCFGLSFGNNYWPTGFPADLHALFQQAYVAGARVHSNSWGGNNQGDYNIESVQTDDFIYYNQDMLITFSAGNFGKDGNRDGVVDTGNMLAAPGTAKNVLTVGASENDRQGDYLCDSNLTYIDSPDDSSCAQQGGFNIIPTWGVIGDDMGGIFPVDPLKSDSSTGNHQQMAAFSSRGPVDDGRIKPDLVAPGTWILSTYSDMFQREYDDKPNPINNAWQNGGWPYPYSQQLKYNGGTSMSNPLVAGGAAVVREYYAETHSHLASAALVKATLINSAVDMLDENNDGANDNDIPIPNSHEGWGLVNLVNATDGSAQFVDDGTALSTNESATYTFSIASEDHPFKATLVWSDYPSTEAASINLVNNLDLVVTSPDGMVLLGNVFSGGWSQPGGSADNRNNVENVYVQTPETGIWTVEITGVNVPNGPQTFALVVDGSFGTPPPQDFKKQYASSEATVSGTKTGSYLDTRSDGAGIEVLKEIESAGKVNVRYSLLEHKWTIYVRPGSAATLYINAWAPTNTDNDTFRLAYATDGATFSDMFTITSATSDPNTPQSFDLSGLSGTITIRVVDSNRTAGKKSLDSVYIDYLYIETDLRPGTLPNPPSGLSAKATSESQINLAWVDNADNETGFYVERSLDGEPISRVATLPANTNQYADLGLNASTTYHYRVQAYNGTGFSTFTEIASATTQESTVQYMHVGGLAGSSTISGSRWTAKVTITAHKADHTPLAGVVVSGAWSAGATGTATCTTGADGICTVSKTNLKTSVLSVKFTPSDLVLSGYTYQPLTNEITEVTVNQK